VNDATNNRIPTRTVEPTPDDFCAVLTRELRSPLSTIEGYLDLLANGGVGPVSDEQREFLDVIGRNVRRLVAVVGDWHDMARLEAGRLELVQEAVDLEEIADRAIAALRPGIRAKEQQVTVDVSATPCVAVGDARAILRAAGNLISNAHKYTPRRGSIRIMLGPADDGMVRLDVADTGIGIRDEDQPHLFRKFFRADLTDAEPGTGLGLTLTQVLVERMGGRVLVHSVLGKGSTFSIVLPAETRVVAGVLTAGVVGKQSRA
jgi:signal transduction histidine kinase